MNPQRPAGWVILTRVLLYRVLPPLLVITGAMLAFRFGVNTTDRGNIPDNDFFAQLYYSLGLFALGGMDLGMPISGPPAWRYVLLTTYFAAPTIAAVTVIEGLWLAFQPWLRVNWPWRNHIVIAGAGRVGWSCIKVLRETHKRTNVLVVDHTPGRHAHRLLHETRVHYITGNISDVDLLGRLRLDRARCVLLLTDDEVVNMETTAQIASGMMGKKAAALPILARVNSLQLRDVANTVFDDNVHIVNLHESVAEHFFQDCSQHIQRTTGRDVLVLAGFGRFSQTFLRCFLREGGANELASVHLIDPNVELEWARFITQQPDTDAATLNALVARTPGRIHDPRVWEPLIAAHGARRDTSHSGHNIVIVLGTNDYQENLRTALLLHDQLPHAFIAPRTFHPTAFAGLVEEHHNIRVIYVEEDLERRIRDEWLPNLLPKRR